MQFNSHAQNLDIVSEINTLCDSDAESYTINDKTRRVNSGMEILVAKIITADGVWQFDDTNYTDNPRGTGTLVEGQESYAFTSEYLEIEQVDVLDIGGRWRRLKQLDPDDLGGLTPEEYFGSTTSSTTKGLPLYYDIQGDSIRLYPAPTSTAVTLSGGLRVFFKRTASLFTTSDTTKEPGIASPFHILLAYYASIAFCATYKKDRVAWLQLQWDNGIKDLIKFYGHRNEDRRKVMRMNRINHI